MMTMKVMQWPKTNTTHKRNFSALWRGYNFCTVFLTADPDDDNDGIPDEEEDDDTDEDEHDEM